MIAIVGDTHGHVQLALCVLARWQIELGTAFDGVLFCGDVGSFTTEEELDNATRAHAKRNPIELEFFTQWSTSPQAPWLDFIFREACDGGLGLTCPVVMVHGNHEGFQRLEQIAPPGAAIPDGPTPVNELPAVDTNGHIRYLPSGWRTVLGSGQVIAGAGGIERGQRAADYHPMAYLSDRAIEHLASGSQTAIDVLVTHQGPACTQGDTKGSVSLDLLADAQVAKVWFHGHSICNPEPRKVGREGRTVVVPLADIAFPGKGPQPDDAGKDGWATLSFEDGKALPARFNPAFLRDFRRHLWLKTADGRMIAPPLRQIAWSFLHGG